MRSGERNLQTCIDQARSIVSDGGDEDGRVVKWLARAEECMRTRHALVAEMEATIRHAIANSYATRTNLLDGYAPRK